jgi:large subunit ribosomal protein L9
MPVSRFLVMKVIFLKDVPKIARKYDIKDVADGFAQNSLLPRKLAIAATPAAVAKIEAEKAAARGVQAKTEESVATLARESAAQPIVIEASANAQGHLFKGVGQAEVAQAIKGAFGIELRKEDIDLAHPLKEVGTHTVAVKSGSARGECTITITAK